MNKAEIKAIWEEMTFLSKDVFFDLLTYAFQKPFDYLVLDRDNNEYYRKFNKIEIYNKEDYYAEKTVSKKKHNHKTVQKKQRHTMSQSQSQTVHVHLHKNTRSQKTQSHVHKKTTSTPGAIPFVSPLPMYHPLNNNVPYSSFSSTYPINSFTNQAAPLVPQAV